MLIVSIVINKCSDLGMNYLVALVALGGTCRDGIGVVVAVDVVAAESIAIRSLAPVCFQDLQPKDPVIKS